MYPFIWLLDVLGAYNLIPEIINQNILFFVGPYYLFWSVVCFLLKKYLNYRNNIFYSIFNFYISCYPVFFAFGFIVSVSSIIVSFLL
jgi:hypothetical protein